MVYQLGPGFITVTEKDSKQHPADGTVEFSASAMDLVQQDLALGFPNPDREGCPDEGVYKALLASGKLPTGEMKAHLLGCSQCYLSFRSLKTAHDTANSGKHPERRSVLAVAAGTRAVSIILGLLVLVSILFAFSNLWSDDREVAAVFPQEQTESHLATGQSPISNAGPEVSSSTRSDPSMPQSPVPDSRVRKTAETTVVDAEEVAVRRGKTTGGEPSVKVLFGDRKFRFKLPRNSPVGEYSVTAYDASGRRQFEKLIVRSNGVTVDFKMRLPATGEIGRICVAFADEVPDCFTVVPDTP